MEPRPVTLLKYPSSILHEVPNAKISGVNYLHLLYVIFESFFITFLFILEIIY